MKEVRFGIAGLGRLGKVHAGNIASRIPGAKLVAACSIVEAELEYAREKLGITKTYTDFREMVQDPDLDAVAIVTTSSEHCWQIEAALDAGKHVFCDKPLGVTLEECEIARAAVERHPELTFMLGFMRRFDPSYAYAKRKIERRSKAVRSEPRTWSKRPASIRKPRWREASALLKRRAASSSTWRSMIST